LYSPVCDAFGPSEGPVVLGLDGIQPLLEEFQMDLKHSLSSLRIIERILGSDDPCIPIKHAVEAIANAQENPERFRSHPPAWFVLAKAVLNMASQSRIILSPQELTDHLCSAFADADFLTPLADHKARLVVEDGVMRSLLLSRGFEAGKVIGDLYLPMERAADWKSGGKPDQMTRLVLAEVIENTKKGLPGSTTITIQRGLSSAPTWHLEVRNEVGLDYAHFLQDYWRVKQRHVYWKNPEDNSGKGTGMGLYVLRLFATKGGFDFEVNSPISPPGAGGSLLWCVRLKFATTYE
jgi:hypothetical protein